jgi:hypothetical protein
MINYVKQIPSRYLAASVFLFSNNSHEDHDHYTGHKSASLVKPIFKNANDTLIFIHLGKAFQGNFTK